jgi:hypothetical protein
MGRKLKKKQKNEKTGKTKKTPLNGRCRSDDSRVFFVPKVKRG